MADDLTGLGKALEPFTKEIAKQIESLLGPVAKEIGEHFGDKVRYLRLKRTLKICERVKMLLHDHTIEPKTVPLKTLLPILEGASLEEEDSDLTVQWMGLLASASSGNKIHPRYPKILSELSPADAKLLNIYYDCEIVERVNRDNISSVVAKRSRLEKNEQESCEENLIYLGLLIRPVIEYQAFPPILTTFGRLFIEACRGPYTQPKNLG